MSNQYRLLGLGNSELVTGLSELVRQSNLLTGDLLAHLVELEARKLHLELGFSSLFAYCVEALGMSEGTAGRRVTAARVCRRFPDAFERVARGALHLCALCALAPYLGPENAAELFDACQGKTRRQIEALLAARFPRPDVREQIRRLPARASLPAERSERNEPPPQARNDTPSSVPVPSVPVPSVPVPSVPVPSVPVPSVPVPSVPVPRRRELVPLAADRFGVHFTADAELRELIERARALASHRLPNGDLASLMKLMVTSFVRREEQRRFGVGARSRRAKTETQPARSALRITPPGGASMPARGAERTSREGRAMPTGTRGRYLNVAVRRAAYTRDRGQCAFVSAQGRRCTARTFLELDHRQPFARFGAADASNIRLLCRAHNLLHARNCFGAQHIAAKIAARKRSEPAKQAR